MSAGARRPIVHAGLADYDQATGGYIYNATMREELARLGWATQRMQLPPGFPQPTAAALATIRRQFAGIPDGAIVLIDQVCLARAADAARAHKPRLGWVEVFHHPAVHDLERQSPERAGVEAGERAALGLADLVIASSMTTARALTADYGLPADRIVVAMPGVPRLPARAARPFVPPAQLLSVGAVVPRKGYPMLIEALAGIRDAAWRLAIVGNPDRDPGHVTAILALAASLGVADRIQLRGRLSAAALEKEWQAADLYVAASAHEGFGMAIAEAVARGVPVATTSAGAVGEWLDPACAVMTPVGDHEALRAAIGGLLAEPERLAAMGRAAIAAAEALPRWEESARRVSDALEARLA